MANKRDIKKEIRYVCGDIAAEAMIARDFIKGADKKALEEVVFKIADLQVNALANTEFSFDKLPHDFPTGHDYRKARRQYFKLAYASLLEKFYKKANSIVDEMNRAIPQEVRDRLKKA